MFIRLRRRLYSSIWFYPALYGVLSVVAAIITREIDTGSFYAVSDALPALFLTDAGLAKTIHGIIAASFITITTFTFSTAMVVLTMYMSQLSPRVVENFLNNKSTMRSFGVFVGGFIYSILSLLFSEDGGGEVFSATVAVMYMAIGLIYFIIFINDVSKFIRLNNVIARLHEEALNSVDNYLGMLETNAMVSQVSTKAVLFKIDVSSKEYGYIQRVDRDELSHLAQEHEIDIVFEKVTGQFIYAGDHVFSVHFDTKDIDREKLERELLSTVSLGQHKTQEQDYIFSMQKIVDVALRAISPGINDPNTAIHCIRIIGTLMGTLSHLDKGFVKLGNGTDSEHHAYIEANSFSIVLRDAFDQITHYGYTDPSVVRAIFKALRHMNDNSSSANRGILMDYCDNLYERAKARGQYTEEDLRMIELEYKEATD